MSQRIPWAGSTRKARLPADWEQRRVATRDRAGGRCEGISLHGEPRWHVPTCTGIGAECDHDKRGDDHRLENLRWLSPPCHRRKTQAEAPRRQRQPEQHPGVISQ